MAESRTLAEHPRMAALVEAFRRDARALGHDVCVSDRWGMLSVLVSLQSGPGFLGGAR